MDVFAALADPVRRSLLRSMAAGPVRVVDLASAQPDRVKTMSAAWQTWAQTHNVLPLNPWAKDGKVLPAE